MKAVLETNLLTFRQFPLNDAEDLLRIFSDPGAMR